MENITCRLCSKDTLVLCEDFSEYTSYEDRLYLIFKEYYEKNNLFYKGIPVRMKHYPPDYIPKTGFYHLICENYQHTGNESDRSPNLSRCSRIKWPKTIIEYCSQNCLSLYIWENERKGKRNILLYCPEIDYLVVLGKRRDYLLLITAYPIEYENKRKDLLKEYTDYCKNKQRTSA